MSDQIVPHTLSEITTVSNRKLAKQYPTEHFCSHTLIGLCLLGVDIDHLE